MPIATRQLRAGLAADVLARPSQTDPGTAPRRTPRMTAHPAVRGRRGPITPGSPAEGTFLWCSWRAGDPGHFAAEDALGGHETRWRWRRIRRQTIAGGVGRLVEPAVEGGGPDERSGRAVETDLLEGARHDRVHRRVEVEQVVVDRIPVRVPVVEDRRAAPAGQILNAIQNGLRVRRAGDADACAAVP